MGWRTKATVTGRGFRDSSAPLVSSGGRPPRHPPGRSAAGRDFARLPRRAPRAALPGPLVGEPSPAGERTARFSPANRRTAGDPRSGGRGRPGPRDLAAVLVLWPAAAASSPTRVALERGCSLGRRDRGWFSSWSRCGGAEVSAPALGSTSTTGHRRRILACYRRTAGSRPRALGSTLTLGLIRADSVNCGSPPPGASSGRPRSGGGLLWPATSPSFHEQGRAPSNASTTVAAARLRPAAPASR